MAIRCTYLSTVNGSGELRVVWEPSASNLSSATDCLTFRLEVRVDNHWVRLDARSYETLLPVGSAPEVLVRASRLILDAITPHLRDAGYRLLCEELAWMSPAWFAPNSVPAGPPRPAPGAGTPVGTH